MAINMCYALTAMEGVLTKCEECGKMILEKGIPVPPARRGKWNFLDEMEIGDSIAVTSEKEYDNARTAMRQKKMRYRSMKEPNGTGYRIWRIG